MGLSFILHVLDEGGVAAEDLCLVTVMTTEAPPLAFSLTVTEPGGLTAADETLVAIDVPAAPVPAGGGGGGGGCTVGCEGGSPWGWVLVNLPALAVVFRSRCHRRAR